MGLVVVAVFALSVGHLLGGASTARHRWTPVAATAVIVGAAVTEIVRHHPDWVWSGAIVVAGVLVGSLLTEAAALRDHSVAAGAGLLTRLRIVLRERRRLREHESAPADAADATDEVAPRA